MTSLGVNEFSDSTGLSIGNYADPMRLWVHSFSPRDLKQLFRWTEYLYYNSAQIYAGVKKFAEYPVTEINYLSDSEKLVSATKRLQRVVSWCAYHCQLLPPYSFSFTSKMTDETFYGHNLLMFVCLFLTGLSSLV